jgi:hypothetical protein
MNVAVTAEPALGVKVRVHSVDAPLAIVAVPMV